MSVTPYFPPIADQMLALTSVARLAELADLPAFDAATLDLARAILDQSGAFCAEQLVPLNRVGDRVGARMQDGRVTLPSGFREAHRAWIDGGWGTLAADPEYGGQGFPFVLSVALLEQVASADMAFSLVSMLTSGAIEAIRTHGAYDLKRTFLPRLVSGEWTGTMSLTEPQAGSDVGAIRTRALHKADGSYSILGTKIFISWGDHELADNITHLVLARLPGAPEGTKGISLFLVPKNLVGADGSIGRRNDVVCLGLEHKLGIRASPTCTMEFGANGDCIVSADGRRR